MALRASFTLVAALYIASADAGLLGNLPLPLGRLAVQAVTHGNNFPFLLCQVGADGLPQLLHGFPGGNLLKKIAVLADHIHQGQCSAVGTHFNAIGKGYILTGLSLTSKVHKYFIFNTSGGIGGKAGTFGCVKSGNSFDQTNGANRDQILLIGGLGVVLLEEMKLADNSPGE